MATANPFDLLGDDDNDDPSLLVQKIVSAPVKKAQTAPLAGKTAAQPAKPSAKLPSKPLPPAQAGMSSSVSLFYMHSFRLLTYVPLIFCFISIPFCYMIH